jgi:CheY-like chemotaxis protein
VQRALQRIIARVYPGEDVVVDVVDAAPAAISHLDVFHYDYIICDYNLSAGTGGDVLVHVREHSAFYVMQKRFILYSGNTEEIDKLGHNVTIDKLDLAGLTAALREGA